MSGSKDTGRSGERQVASKLFPSVGDDPKYWFQKLMEKFAYMREADLNGNDELKSYLVLSWPALHGEETEGIGKHLTSESIEDFKWSYPILSFKVQVGDGIGPKLTRVPLLTVEVDTNHRVVIVARRGARKINDRQVPFDVHEAAYRAVVDLKSNKDCAGVRLLDGGLLEVLPGHYIPQTGPASTFRGRSKVFGQIVERLAVLADLEQHDRFVFSRRGG